MDYGKIKKNLVLRSLNDILDGLNKSDSWDEKDIAVFSQLKHEVIIAIEKITTIKTC